MPLTLAFDATGSRLAVGLFLAGRPIAERAEMLDRGHAERLFPLINDIMDEASRDLAGIELIAVCTGPGNFTGARIGVAAARGLALSCKATAVGVDRFEALIEGHHEGEVTVALNARGGALHIARFRNGILSGSAETVAADVLPTYGTDQLVLGDGADDLIAASGQGEAGNRSGDAPLSALAAIAARRAKAGHPPRPAPRYLKPANAAPPRETAPQIL